MYNFRFSYVDQCVEKPEGHVHISYYLCRQVCREPVSVQRDMYKVIFICVDECVENPCLYGGTCTDGVDYFTCACPRGFSGDKCQTRPAKGSLCSPDPCGSTGICVEDYSTSKTRCICEPGYTSGKNQ